AVFNGSFNHQDYPTSVCELSLSGVPACSRWNLTPGGCQDVEISSSAIRACGEAADCVLDLECDTDYIIWVKAHNVRQGPNGTQFNDVDGVVCRTAACPTGNCTLTWGYWKNHGPGDCHNGNNPDAWGLTTIPVGGLNLSAADACAILHDSPSAC